MRWFAGLIFMVGSACAQAAPAEFFPPVPDAPGNVVVVNVPQARVSLYEDQEPTASWPAGPGAARSQTPLGSWRVGEIRENPTWNVPLSIQKEMARKGQRVRAAVKPGPGNPLGPYFIRLGRTAIGLHGTNAPRSVPGWPSHGCIRMVSEDVTELASVLSPGDRVHVVYEPLLVEEENGEVYLQVHPDVYRKGADLYSLDRVYEVLQAKGIELQAVNEERIEHALRARSRQAVWIGRTYGN